MPASNSAVNQMICAYNPENPSDNRGFGPVAASFGMPQAVSLFKLAERMLRPPATPPPHSTRSRATYCPPARN